MSFTVWGTLALTAVAVLLIPMLAFTYRLVIKWTKAEAKLDETVKDLGELVKDKDEAHKWLYEQIDRSNVAMDKRLRWLEENLWRELRKR